MEHLVESHLGGHYVSNKDPKVIRAYCEECGDHDHIILSWEKEKKMETLLEYFSRIKMSKEELEEEKKDLDMPVEAWFDKLYWDYDNDKDLISELWRDKIINLEERNLLLKQVMISQKEQFRILKEVFYPEGFTKKYKK